ncbi:MAG: PepSY domain-containing protein [Verrucomicrobiae bacterium]|nr:PepSY domain-containing protein [Verrucomicrobiae bacterium]
MTTGSTAIRPSLRTRWTPRLWSFHAWLGLLFAVPLLLVSLTGALLVRYDWVERGFDRTVFRAGPATNAAPLTDVIRRLALRHSGAQVRFLERPGDPARNPVFSVHGPELRRSVIADAVTGGVLLERDEATGARRWLLRFHDSLHAGKAGELIVALSALALLGLALSGLWIRRGALRGLLRIPRIRGRPLRVLAGEWHRWIGTAALLMLLLWALTGVWLSLPSLLTSERRRELPAARYDWTTAPAIEPMLAEARRRFPESDLDFLSLPSVPGDPFTLTLVDRDRWLWNKLTEMVFDGSTGALLRTQSGANGGWLMKANLTVAVLHFGHLGGALMKWLWLVFGFTPAFLAVSGGLIWWRRKRR